MIRTKGIIIIGKGVSEKPCTADAHGRVALMDTIHHKNGNKEINGNTGQSKGYETTRGPT